MKLDCHFFRTILLPILAGLMLLMLSPCALAQSPATQPAPSLSEIQRLNERLDEQTRRIDRLYRAVGPMLEQLEQQAAELEKQQQDDARLAIPRVAEVTARELSIYGCMNPAAAEFAVITTTGAVHIYDAQGNRKNQISAEGQLISAIAFSPDGKTLLAGTQEGSLMTFNLATGGRTVVAPILGSHVHRVCWVGPGKIAWGTSIDYWKDGSPINLTTPAGAVLDRSTGLKLFSFMSEVFAHYDTLAGSRDGRYLAVSEIPTHPRAAFVLDAANGQILQTCYDSDHGSGPLSVALSPDGKTLAVGYAPYDIILWDIATGKPLHLLEGHRNWVVSLGFSADSKRLVSGGGDSTMRVWDVPGGKEIGRVRFPGPSTYTHAVGLSPDGLTAFALVEGHRLVISRVPR
jgi:WD40 repeat protein